MKKIEIVTNFIFLGYKITSDGDCSHKWKDACSLEKSYDKTRQHIKMQRHHFADKVCIVKAMAFPVVMYGCKSWTGKKAEH